MQRIVLAGLAGILVTANVLAQAPKAEPATKPAPKPAVNQAAKPTAKTATAPKGSPALGSGDLAAVLQTKLGKIVIKFFPEKAPNHVKNFQTLVKSGFYNGTKFHRVVPGFMIQGGDPNTKKGDKSTWGQGGHEVNGKEVTVKAEFNDIHHARGIVSMARAQDPNSASSQFFICVADAGFLDRQYTVFGEVIEGMDVVDKIVNAPKDPQGPDNPEGSRPASPVSIDKAVLEPLPAKVAAPATPPATAEQPAAAVQPAPGAPPAPVAPGK
jgi:peptidyl-prolyl cis-trans isomerase B (cyclophilin B)